MALQSRSIQTSAGTGRRTVLRRMSDALATAPALPALAACGSKAGSDPKTVTSRSNGGDALLVAHADRDG